MTKKAGVLLADCALRSGLAVARSLERAGVSVVAIADKADNMVFRSRYVKNRVVVPSPDIDPTGFVERTLSVGEDYGARLAIPITDRAIRLVDQHRDVFPPTLKLGLAEPEALRCVLDKNANLEIARRVGIPCPKEFHLENVSQVPEMIEALGQPVVLKNPAPEMQSKESGLPFRFLVAHDENQLTGYVKEYSSYDVKPLYQEYASGRTYNICCFAAEGETLAIHQYISKRRGAHAGIFREIVPLEPDLETHTRRMLRELRWSGVAHLQFIVDHEAEKVWYMETNGRFWASTQGSVNAGWDFPYWFYNYFANGEKPEVGPIRIGSQTVYRRADLDTLISYLRGGPSPTVYTDPGKMWAIRQYIASFSTKVQSDVCSWRDPMPGISDLWDLGKKYGVSMVRRFMPGSRDSKGGE
jgi:predicted ATP-grasp superfamily ATP-dependent carboligase